MPWPSFARFTAEYELGSDNDVERTEFDDGAVRQAKRFTSAQVVRAVTVELTPAELAQFRAWAAEEAHTFFTIVDPFDGEERQARVRGGKGGIRYRQVARFGQARWAAEMTLEGPENNV